MLRFLFPDYSKCGPGIDRNAPKKTGIPLFIETFTREFTTLLKLNIIFIVYCIPIVTIGPAIGGMTYVTLKMVKDEPSDVYYDFKEGFKKNWKQSSVLGLLGILILISLVLAFLLYFQLHGIEYYGMMFVIGIASLMIGMMWIYIYPMAVGVNLRLVDVIRNSFILSTWCIKHSLSAFLICITIIVMGVIFMPISILSFFIFSFSFCSFVSSFCAWSGISKKIIK